MVWFRRKQSEARVTTDIATFKFDNGQWISEPTSQNLIFLLDSNELDVRTISLAQSLLERIDHHSELAINFAKTHGSDLWDGKGQLKLEAIDITDLVNDQFGLVFGVTSNSDYTVTVEFRGGQPQSVWTGD